MYDRQVRLSIGKNFSDFYPYTIKFNQLPELLCTANILYSPTQYKDNKRKSANFLGFADFLVLDFDEGWTQEQEDLFNQFIGYKVPTKSHMKEKNGIVCERYRILLLLEKPVQLNYQEYKRMYKHIMRDLNLNSDTACVDACRFYYSAEQPVTNCIKLKGNTYFPWEKYNYKDFQYASLNNKKDIDISAFKGMDLSYLANLNPSKRYPCPICQLEGFDQKGHHLGFNKDEDYPTCFFEEEHSKILRKLYNLYKYGTIEEKMEDINDMVREKCTPDLIKTGKYNPKPTNYSDNLLELYDKMLDTIEKDDIVCLDIETFCEEYVAETYEEAEARLSANYKYIKGAYNAKWDEFKGVGLDTFKNKIRIITLEGNGAVCPFDMYYARQDQIQRILNIVKSKMIVGHNIKFDLKSIMASYGEEYCPNYCFDTMIASRMIHMALDPEESAVGHNLEATVYRFLEFKMNKEIEHSWGNDNLTEEQLKYAGMDVKVLRPLMKEQIRQFKQIYGPFDTVNYDISKIMFLGPLMNEHPILALEMQTLLEVIRIEFVGVKPNIPMMEKAIDEFNRQIDETDAELGINCGSSKDCIAFLKQHVDPSIESSAAGVLSEYEDKSPLVKKMKEAKAARTRRGLMVSMSDTNIHPYDKRIHPKFNQLLSTGRFACSNPNMQQIPKTIKNDIYVSNEDGVVFDTDYAAVELRIETVVAEDPVFLEAYRNNTDMHYLTASKIFGRKIPHTKEEKEDAEKNENSEFIPKWQRGFAKACNFGLIYGIAKNSFIAMNLWTGLTEQQCGDAYDKFFESYPGVAALIKNARQTFMMGENRQIDRWLRNKAGSIYKSTKTVPFFTTVRTLIGRILTVDTERKMMNYRTQGSGADIIKIAICKMGYETRKLSTSYRTINMVHDDTIGSSKIVDFDKNSAIFRNALEFAVNYVLRYKFYTPVNQDFCILSLLGDETFLEEALTLEDIDAKLVAKIQHLVELMEKEEDIEEKTKLTVQANQQYKLLEKFRKYIKDNNLEKAEDTQINENKS